MAGGFGAAPTSMLGPGFYGEMLPEPAPFSLEARTLFGRFPSGLHWLRKALHLRGEGERRTQSATGEKKALADWEFNRARWVLKRAGDGIRTHDFLLGKQMLYP